MRLTMNLTGLALAGVFTVSVVASAIAHDPDSQGSGQGQMPMMGHQGMMGQGHMPMMGQGMMGQGHMPMMGQGMMDQMPMMGGYGYGQMQPLRRDLTTDEVKHMMEHRVDWAGNPNLKVGKITEQDADTIVTEIVTKDGSLVRKIEVDRHTGRMQAVQ
ncbi:hypothetical protein [Limibacillus sp. MBR-115]|uniref:hypothetical protein n=1 Tax=Limibacillus sp. MBR-115 TaxID=3156465 RepID=UPI0033930732